MDSPEEVVGSSLGEYPTIASENMQKLKSDIVAIANKYPDAALTGGAALRVWCEQLGVPVPEEFGFDRDVAVFGEIKYGQERNADTGTVDLFSSKVPFQPPFFVSIPFEGMDLKIATLPHLLSHKMSNMRGELKRGGKVMAKDIIYLDLLKQLVPDAAMSTYYIELKKARPELAGVDIYDEIRKLEDDLSVAKSSGNISESVHPE